jgi:Ca2+/H+ antiporter
LKKLEIYALYSSSVSVLLAGIIGISLLIGGSIYRYKFRKCKPETGNVLSLILLSFVTALAVVYTIGSIDFFFFHAAWLGFGVDDLKIAALVGSILFGYLAIDRFVRFIRKKNNEGR